MFITMLTPSLAPHGGVVKIFEYAVSLRKLGHAVSIVQSHPEEQLLPAYYDEQAPWYQWYVDTYGITIIRLDRIPHKPDLCFFSWDPDWEHVCRLKCSKVVHIIQHFRPESGPRHALLGEDIENITVSSAVQQNVAHRCRNEPRLIVNCIDTDLFQPDPQKQVSSHILAVSWKEAERHVEYIQQLIQRWQHSGIQFTIDLIATPITPRKLARHFQKAGIVVCINKGAEGFSLTPLEAMACGCLVICTDMKGNSDYALDNLVCKVVDVNLSLADISDITMEYMNNQDGRTSILIGRATAMAQKLFSLQRQDQQLQAFMRRFEGGI